MEDVRRARDLDLLDALDGCPREVYAGSLWRVVREGRDPLLGSRPSARWDPGSFDVLYTSLERDGALAEMYFHLSRQPVFPTAVNWQIHEIQARTQRTLRLANLEHLRKFGVDVDRFGELEYSRTQAIGDAAYFLGFDGLLVPSARWPCLNLVIFSDRTEPGELSLKSSDPVDWSEWRRARRQPQ